MDDQLRIFTYHRVHDDGDVTVPDDPGRVNASDFQQQMTYLANAGFQTVTHHQIAAWLWDGKPLPPRAVALDFDDNRLNVFENAFPIMHSFHFTGTVFTVTNLANGELLPKMDHYPAMRWAHLLELRDVGWCIAPHTCTHRLLTKISLDETRQEMIDSYQRVRDMTGEDAPYFAYPNGHWNDELEAIAKQVFRTARHWHHDDAPLVTRHTDPYRLPAVNVAANMTMPRFQSLTVNRAR